MPPLVSPVGTVDIIEGSNITLTCDDPGNTGTTRFVWINDTDDNALTQEENNTPLELPLNNINRTASGNYTCRSTNTDLPGIITENSTSINVQCKNTL